MVDNILVTISAWTLLVTAGVLALSLPLTMKAEDSDTRKLVTYLVSMLQVVMTILVSGRALGWW